jgi:hypothetical protein
MVRKHQVLLLRLNACEKLMGVGERRDFVCLWHVRLLGNGEFVRLLLLLLNKAWKGEKMEESF